MDFAKKRSEQIIRQVFETSNSIDRRDLLRDATSNFVVEGRKSFDHAVPLRYVENAAQKFASSRSQGQKSLRDGPLPKSTMI